MIIKTKNRQATIMLGREIASRMKGGEVLCLYGTLGSGKTTFMSGFVDYFLPGKRVLSPTFIIVRHYSINLKNIRNILHADLYRLDEVNNLKNLGLAEFMNQSDSIIAIEWADKLGNNLPEKRVDIYFKIEGEESREIEIQGV